MLACPYAWREFSKVKERENERWRGRERGRQTLLLTHHPISWLSTNHMDTGGIFGFNILLGSRFRFTAKWSRMCMDLPSLHTSSASPTMATVHRSGASVTNDEIHIISIRARLSDFTFTFHFHAMEKEMATHSSVLAWRIPGTAEPGGLPSMESHRVRHDWSNVAAAAASWPYSLLEGSLLARVLWVWTRSHRYSIIHKSFTALRILCGEAVISSQNVIRRSKASDISSVNTQLSIRGLNLVNFITIMNKYFIYQITRVSLVAQMVKNPPAIRETWAQSLG